ncbi:DNA polymerase III subunit delta [Candidatus Parcubacteria bacterium]|nr:DNA polymerase III subunit delta [Patescibacteria group bacterium]MBU4466818.1 DNA polymerase III subunit delta [Patescibacteria group bacterium]MCG2688121.1 DNA polymerase III subunit delta [Candidatus Parcubacteria bacterium]
MTILLYGQDGFRSRLKLKEIIDQYRKVRHRGLNLFLIDFKEDHFSDFREKIETVSIFADKRLIVLSNLLNNQNLSQEILHYLKSNGQKYKNDILVFFEDDKFSAGNPLFVFLKKTANIQEFKLLSGKPLFSWIEKEVGILGGKIDPLALKRLAEIFSNDLWFLANEIKKLVAFKNRKKIEIQDIESLIGFEAEANIFKTIDAIASLNRKLALKLLNHHLESGDSPIYLLTMINYQFRNILIIKDLSQKNMSWPMILKESNLNGFVAQKCYSLANRFSFSRLKVIYSELLVADLKIKTGKVSPRQGLELLVSQI